MDDIPVVVRLLVLTLYKDQPIFLPTPDPMFCREVSLDYRGRRDSEKGRRPVTLTTTSV